jgi:Ca2+-binding EF-hand superfamily protein
MKKTIAAVVAVAAAAGLSMAFADQGDDKGFGRRGGRTQLLEKYDANKNGVLDADEKEAAKAEWESHRQERQARMLERFDANKNGVLDPEEKDAARKEMRGHRGHGRRGDRAQVLEKFDANKNGTLDPEEKQAAKAAREARRAETLKKYDADGDGKLSDSERETLRKEMREKHQHESR